MGGSSKSSSTTQTTQTTRDERETVNVEAQPDSVAVGGFGQTVNIEQPAQREIFEVLDTIVRQQGEFLADSQVFLGETFSTAANLAGARDDIRFEGSGTIAENTVLGDEETIAFAKHVPIVAAALAVGAVGYYLVKD